MTAARRNVIGAAMDGRAAAGRSPVWRRRGMVLVTADELAARTSTMAAEGVTVCWVTDKDRPFIGHVPSICIRSQDQDEGLVEPETGLLAVAGPAGPPQVIDGLAAFKPTGAHTAPTARSQHSTATTAATKDRVLGTGGGTVPPRS